MVGSSVGRVAVSGPLGLYAEGFRGCLLERGYAGDTVARHLRLLAALSGWLEREGLDASALTPAVLARFRGSLSPGAEGVCRNGFHLLVCYLRDVGVMPLAPSSGAAAGPVEVLLEHYRCYLVSERCLAEETIRNYLGNVRPFLKQRVADGQLDLERLTADEISAFVQEECSRHPRQSVKVTVTALRSLLRFLHCNGVLDESLTGAVPSVAFWRLAGLPQSLEGDRVGRLLASCDRGTPGGRRDFAILLLLVRLGLRRGEVARLSLDDLDWCAGELIVRGKGDRRDRMPLPIDVGEALVDYLSHGRPTSKTSRSVFIRVMAPLTALSSGAVGGIVKRAARRAGIGDVNAHRLRHTVATEALRKGAPLAEVGELLRHAHLSTTAIYAKVDRERLHILARPWPGVTA
jgi:integrase/recombinase XerD